MKKVTLKSDLLWKALDLLKKYTSKNGGLPILDDTFYFNVSVNQIELISNQLSHCAKVVFPAQSSSEFCGVLQFSRLYQFLDPDLLPSQPIVITLNDAVLETVYPYEDSKDEAKRAIARDKIVEENRVIVDYQNGKTKSSWEDCLDYPQWVKKEEKKIGVMDTKTFLKTLDGLQIVTNFGKTKVLYYDNTAYFITNTAYDKLLKLKQTETIELFLAKNSLKFTAKIDDYSIEYYLKIQDSKDVKDQQEEVKKAIKENKLLPIENYFASEKKINEIVDNKKTVNTISEKLQELREKYKKASYVQISGNNYFEKIVKVNPKGLVTSSDSYSLTHPVQTIIYTDELNKYEIKPRMMRSGSKLVESEKMFEITEKKVKNDNQPIYPKGTILNFILENSSKNDIQKAVKSFDLKSLGFYWKRNILLKYPKYRGKELYFSLELSEDLRPYQVDWEYLQKINREIDETRRLMKLYGKYHPQYNDLLLKHDMLVLENNKLNEPINNFLELYQQKQKELGKSIKIVNKKENISIPKEKIDLASNNDIYESFDDYKKDLLKYGYTDWKNEEILRIGWFVGFITNVYSKEIDEDRFKRGFVNKRIDTLRQCTGLFANKPRFKKNDTSKGISIIQCQKMALELYEVAKEEKEVPQEIQEYFETLSQEILKEGESKNRNQKNIPKILSSIKENIESIKYDEKKRAKLIDDLDYAQYQISLYDDKKSAEYKALKKKISIIENGIESIEKSTRLNYLKGIEEPLNLQKFGYVATDVLDFFDLYKWKDTYEALKEMLEQGTDNKFKQGLEDDAQKFLEDSGFKKPEKPSIKQRIADLKIILELDETDEKIKQRIADLELIDSL